MTTIALTRPDNGVFFHRPFSPSGARPSTEGTRVNPFAELVLNTTIWIVGLSPFPSVAVALPVQTHVEQSASVVRSGVLRSQEMAMTITGRLGFPVSALASVLDVQRKTVYDWINGVDAQPSNAESLRILHDAFLGEPDGSFLFYHRFWRRELPIGGSLQEVLMASSSGVLEIKDALNELRPAVTDALASYARRKALSLKTAGPADHLAEYLEAGDRG